MIEAHWAAIALAAAICLAAAVLGNLWVGDALTTWYPRLNKPRGMAPLWLFILVGVSVYVIEGVVLYRLFTRPLPPAARLVCLTAVVVLIFANEAWNYAFFGLRSTLAALVGIVAFLAPLGNTMAALAAYDPVSAALLVPYCLWVGYDVWWVHQLWRLNPQDAA